MCIYLHLGTPLPLQVEDFHYSQVHLESPLFLKHMKLIKLADMAKNV